MSKSIFFYVTMALKRSETGVKVIPSEEFQKQLETYRRSVTVSLRDKKVIQGLIEGSFPEISYPAETDIKDIEKDLKDKGILTKINTDRYRLKESYVDKLEAALKIEVDEKTENLANAAGVSPQELENIKKDAEDVVSDGSIPKEKQTAEVYKRFQKRNEQNGENNKKPFKKKRWFKKPFFKKSENSSTKPVEAPQA